MRRPMRGRLAKLTSNEPQVSLALIGSYQPRRVEYPARVGRGELLHPGGRRLCGQTAEVPIILPHRDFVGPVLKADLVHRDELSAPSPRRWSTSTSRNVRKGAM